MKAVSSLSSLGRVSVDASACRTGRDAVEEEEEEEEMIGVEGEEGMFSGVGKEEEGCKMFGV